MDAGTFISIDTETTGLSFKEDRVIQFGFTLVTQSRIAFTNSFYIQTNVPNAGFEINRITDEQIASGRNPKAAFTEIAGIIREAKVICIYNAPFDLTMLANEFNRYEIPYDFTNLYVIDPLLIERHFKPYHAKPFYRLAPTAARYGVQWDGEAHDAGSDSAASATVWLTQRSQLCIRKHILDLHRAQIKWYQKWAFEFEIWGLEHHRDDIVIVEWPVEKGMKCSQKGIWQSLY